MPLSAVSILEVLDRSAEFDWPDFWGIVLTEYHALRLLAVRSRTGDDWGLIFDSVRGSVIDDGVALTASVWSRVYGSRVEIGLHHLSNLRPIELVLPEDRDRDSLHLEGIEIEGPAGKLLCKGAMIADLDLRPDRVCNLDRSSESPLDKLCIRAYLATFPGSLWPSVESSAALLGIEDAEIVAVSDAFEHVLGPQIPADRGDLHPLALLPGASPTYRSLAEALAARDPARFNPGSSNLDWRRWAVYVDDKAPTIA